MLRAADEFQQALEAVEFCMPDTKIIHNVSVEAASSPHEIQSLLVSQFTRLLDGLKYATSLQH